MSSKFLLLPLILCTLFASSSSPATRAVLAPGEISTIETLISYRASCGNVWKDLQTDEPLHRLNDKNVLVQAGYDADVTLTTPNSVFNAGTLLASYLMPAPEVVGGAAAANLPQPSVRSAELTIIASDTRWSNLLTLLKRKRLSLGRVAKDCLNHDLFELNRGVRNQAADIRDIKDIPSLISALEPVINELVPPAAPGVVARNLTGAETSNFNAFQAFRVRNNLKYLDPRTGEQLYRIVNDAPVPAAKDDDVARDLSNLVELATSAMQPATVPAGVIILTGLQAIFNDPNLNRLYQITENTRRRHGSLLTDAIGAPIYLVNSGNRAQAVKMFDIIDTNSLFNAIFNFFPVDLRPVVLVNVCSCGTQHN